MAKEMTLDGTEHDAALLARAEHGDPFRFLGPHVVERDGARRVAVRAIQPNAASVQVLWGGVAVSSAQPP